MKAHEILRAAGDVIQAGGWSQGSHARDDAGNPVPLFAGDVRAAIHPHAKRFSIYGAICKASADQRVEEPLLLWSTLGNEAEKRWQAATGGNNNVHAIIGFNDAEGRMVEEVLALLDDCAAQCERLNKEAVT